MPDAEYWRRVRRAILHLAGWISLLLLPYLFSFKKAVQFDQLWTSPHELKNLLSWVLLIGFSYLNHLWLVPAFYLERKRFRYFLLAGLGLAAILWLPEALNWFRPAAPLPAVPAPEVPPKPALVLENSHVFLLFVVSILVSIAYQAQIRLKETEQQRLQAELSHLKAQIQPHFLFNTLNSIYALALRKDGRTADTIVQLSEFLRYVIRDAQQNLVPLEKEMAYIRNYFGLQQSRLRDTVNARFELTGACGQLQIAPLILFSFVENAFKHGASPDEESEVDIRATVVDNEVSLCVFNKKVKVDTPSAHTGIGIENTRQRLKLLYPERHTLKIIDTETEYKVQLNVLL